MIFSEITGHKREKEILHRALASRRVAHAYLFSGPPGVGKRTLALAFARAMNCPEIEVGYCGLCRDCEAVDKGSHENVIEVVPVDKDGEPAKNGLIRIPRVREVIKALHFRAESGRRVVIIDDAHRLAPQAANAMLKTLEEPPEGAVIILVSSMPRFLLPTIVSRSQILNFRPLAVEVVEEFLLEKKGLTAAEAATAARFSGGTIAGAIKYSSSAALEKRIEVLDRLRGISKRGERALIDYAETLSKNSELREILEFMRIWCRDVAMNSAGREELMVNSDLKGYLKTEVPLRAVLDTYSMIGETMNAIGPPRNGNKRLAMEVLLMGMMDRGVLI